MTGVDGGVYGILANTMPQLYLAGCNYHKLHTTCENAMNKHMSDIETFLHMVSKFFRDSPSRQTQLLKIQKNLHIPEVVMLGIKTARWLSRLVSLYCVSIFLQLLKLNLQALVNRLLLTWDALQIFFSDPNLKDKTYFSGCCIEPENKILFIISI